MKCWWMFDAFFTFYVYSMDLFGAFDGFSIDTSWMFGRYSMNAPFHTSYLPLPISHFLFPMSMSLFDRRLPISHCRWLGLAECAERSAALAVWQGAGVSNPNPKSISSNSNLQISNPPQISPQRPCAFRRASPKLAGG